MEFKKILVPLDGSEFSLGALKPARTLACSLGAEIRLVTVEELPDQPAPSDWELTLGTFLDNKREESERYLNESAETLRRHGLNPSFSVLPLGPPAARILEEALHWKADLIVVCSHGRNGLARWVMGSTAERISRKAPCPVMIVHPQSED
ncbi:MAG: universal stress protein [Vulcanimicrobiota bacterium]